jgi:hypothetical protein
VAQRYFTPEEANALLPSVRPVVEQLVEHRRALARAHEKRAEFRRITGGNGGGLDAQVPAEIEAEASAATEGISRCVEELGALGVEVKDAERGLVDFPALRDGEDILLCWELGEDEIRYWHTLDGGFAGRRPLPL